MSAKDGWVERVLGITVAIDAGRPDDLLAIWREAKDEVDARLHALTGRLRRFDDPDLNRIAEFGLYRVGAREGVALTKALFDFNGAAPADRERFGNQVATSVDSYRAALNSRLVQLIDRNPAGVDVAVQRTIGGALDQIEARIRR